MLNQDLTDAGRVGLREADEKSATELRGKYADCIHHGGQMPRQLAAFLDTRVRRSSTL